MNNMLSQEEIDALLGFGDSDEDVSKIDNDSVEILLSEEEKDVLGEIGNISMGTAATTLSSLVNLKVNITTPVVETARWEQVSGMYKKPCVAIRVEYKEGLIGSNLLILHEKDVKVITDLMMGGDGKNINKDEKLSELHLSAICEAMNQMIGSSSTSMFSMFNKKIDILPPVADVLDLETEGIPIDFDDPRYAFLKGDFVKVTFDMKIDDLIDSAMVQLYPMNFARELYDGLINSQSKEVKTTNESKKNNIQNVNSEVKQNQNSNYNQEMTSQNFNNNDRGLPQNNGYNQQVNNSNYNYNQQVPNNNDNYSNAQSNMNREMQQNVDVKPVQFQNFDMNSNIQQKENIDLIMDVPLDVRVELGRTKKPIREILEFSPGTVIELDKLAGDPVDVLVNGKMVAKGEVVVIDEYFGIRVTEIINKKINL